MQLSGICVPELILYKKKQGGCLCTAKYNFGPGVQHERIEGLAACWLLNRLTINFPSNNNITKQKVENNTRPTIIEECYLANKNEFELSASVL